MFEGEIVFVGMAVDPANRTFQVEVRPLDFQNSIKLDMIADVEFIVEDRPSSIVVSEEFLCSDGDGLVVYVESADEAGHPVARKVEATTGPSYKNRFVVTGGLNAGDRFITRDSSYLDDGTRIVLPEAVASNSWHMAQD